MENDWTSRFYPLPCLQVEGQQCVNIPVQKCENVPVTGSVEVPNEKCYKKPRKVCQTLVSTKKKVVTAQIPREHCGHKQTVKHTKPPVKSTMDIMKSPSISRSSDQNSLDTDKNTFEEYFEEDVNRNDNFKQFYEYLFNQNSRNIRGNWLTNLFCKLLMEIKWLTGSLSMKLLTKLFVSGQRLGPAHCWTVAQFCCKCVTSKWCHPYL